MRFQLAGSLVALGLALAGCSSSAAPSVAPSTAPTVQPTRAVGAPCEPVAVAFDATKFALTGPWADDDDGIYYLRQVDKIVWWNGMANRAADPSLLGRDWNNVGRGEIKDDLTIAVEWADVPRGGILGGGTMTLKIEKDAKGNIQLRKVAQASGDFGNNIFTPCSPG